MIGINKNNNDYIVIKSAKLADLISNYQQIITGIEFIVNNYNDYYVIYGDGTLIDKIDNYYTTDIHPSTYDTLVSPKLNRYKIEMSKTIFIISDYTDITKTIAKGTPKELLKIIKDLPDNYYIIWTEDNKKIENSLTKENIFKCLNNLGANL